MPAPRRNLILNAQTLPPVPFDVRVRAAAAAGYRGLSYRAIDYNAALAAGFDDHHQCALLAEHDLEITEVGLAVTWMTDASRPGVDDDEATLWHMTKLFRPRQVNAAMWDAQDRAVTTRAFAALCDRAADQNLHVALEFIPHSGIRDIPAGWAIVEGANRDNGGLILDVWHMHRAGTPAAAIATVPGDKWLTLQLSDASAEPWPEVREESRHGRLLPGDGVIEFAEIFSRLRETGADPLVSVEVISDEIHRLPPEIATARTMAASAAILARAKFEPRWWDHSGAV